MSKDIKIRNGLTINLKGAANNIIKKTGPYKSVSLNPSNFHLIVPKMVVKVGDKVSKGDVVFHSKNDERIKFCSPEDGVIADIVRGAKRKIIEIIINVNKKNDSKDLKPISIDNLNAENTKNILLKSGCWPFIKQRPYDIIANPSENPKSIFISGFNSAPISADLEIILDDQKKEFEMGVNVLTKLTPGNVNVCINKNSASFFNDINGIKLHKIDGPHPAGNVGVQIHHIDPISSGDRVWILGAEDVAIIGRYFTTGKYNPLRTVAVSGPPVKNPQYYKTIAGAEIKPIIEDAGLTVDSQVRIINGDVLTGYKVEHDNYLGFYNNTLSVLREGNNYRMFGWIPFINNQVPSMYKTSFSWLFPQKKYDLDTNLNGEERAFVVTGEMEKVFPMDIFPMQLLKECMAGNIEKMESLGIYEVAPEDFSLVDYSSSSKIEAQYIIRQGLDLMIKEVG